MTSPVERISGPSRVSASGKRVNGSTASLTLTWPPVTGGTSSPSSRSSARVAPAMTRAATLARGTPVALDTNGTVRLARGLASITKTWSGLDRVLHVERADAPRGRRRSRGCSASITAHRRPAERRRRDHAGGVTGVHPGLLDVLHDRADEHLAGAVADGVDVDLDGVLEEAVDQDRPLGRQAPFPPSEPEAGQLVHGPAQVVVVVDDLHGPPAEHVARPHQGRIADPPDDGPGLARSWSRCRRRAGGSRAGRTGRSTAPGPRPGRWRPGRCRAPGPAAAGRPA